MLNRSLRTNIKKYLKINEYDPKKIYLLVPGMVSRSERKNLFTQARKLTGRGHVLEFGAFFGASTSAILHGLKESKGTMEFNVYDYFKTNDPWFSELTKKLAKGYEHLLSIDGEWLDFSRVYENFINDPIVNTHKILISDFKWKKEPIEFIHLDLPKDWAQANVIANETFPYLIHNSKLILQDFVNQWSFELCAMVGFLLKENLIRVDGSFGSTLSTTTIKKFPINLIFELNKEMANKSLILQNFDEAFRQTKNFLNHEEQIILRVGRAILISDMDKNEGFAELSRVINYLIPRAGRGSKAFQNALEFNLQAKKSIV